MLNLIADLLIIVHFVFILFVILGGLLTLKWPRWALLHVPCAFWGAIIEFYGWMCPLTHLELYFRRAANEAGYCDGFIQHYLIPIIYPHNLTREMQLGLGLMVVLLNLAIYGAHFFKKAFSGRNKEQNDP